MNRVCRIAAVLVLPLALLLFLQWPLREWVQAYSRQTNDLAQAIFAVYVAVAVTAASRAGVHLSAQRPEGAAPGRWRGAVLALCVLPWASLMLWWATPQALASVLGLEKFPDTLTPGYFVLRLALVLGLALVWIDALAALRRRAG